MSREISRLLELFLSYEEDLYLKMLILKRSTSITEEELNRGRTKLGQADPKFNSVPEYCYSLDEEGICKIASELIFAFDEVICLGHKDNVAVAYVKQYYEMESHEEKLHKLWSPMAIRTIASKPARQLGELLQEKQEPFALEVYLSEKGCGKQNSTSIHGYGSSGEFLKKSGSNKNKRNKGIPNFPKVLKVILCNKFFTIGGLRTKNSNDEDGNNREAAEADRFSFSSCSALYNSSSDSDTDEATMFIGNTKPSELNAEREKKAPVDTKFQMSRCMEDSKQHSPQSVLEATSTSTGSPLGTISDTREKSFILPKLITTEESILSAALWSLLHHTTAKEEAGCEGLKDLEDCNGPPFSVSKRVLQQTKQLLLDCVRELIDHNKGHGKEGFIGSEEIGNVICEKIRGWGKRCGDETNIREMLELDVMESKQEWGDFEIESWRREMGLLLGNAIVEEITSEVVMDMINIII
ncbi:hypothetical protein V6N13_057070 [Hibiscus sabdariffa]